MSRPLGSAPQGWLDTTASERRSSARTAVVWAALLPVLDGTLLGGPGDVLDIGGGTGGFAVRLAELGHRVQVVDPSPDALAALDRRARESGVADQVTGQQGDLSSLLDVAGPGSADLVLCHGVLEVVDDPAAALATIAEVLRPGGSAQPARRPAPRRRGGPRDGRPLPAGPGDARRSGGRRPPRAPVHPRGAHRPAGRGRVSSPRPSTRSGSSPTWSPAPCSTSSPAPPPRWSSWSRPSPSAPSTSRSPPSCTSLATSR